jgi:hypothetical protein
MFISRVGIITLSFALGSAWGRLFFAPVSMRYERGEKGNKKSNSSRPVLENGKCAGSQR